MRRAASVLVVALLVMVFAAVDVEAQGSPWIEADLGSDSIELLDYPVSTLVTVEIDGQPWEVWTPANGDSPRLERWTHGQDLVPGTVVTATAAGQPNRSLILDDVRVDVVNPDTDTVVVAAAGMTPPVVTLWLPENQTSPQVTSTFDAVSGRWLADFGALATPFDVEYGQWVGAAIADGDGDRTIFGKSTPYVDVVRPGPFMWEAVVANDFSPDTTLCVEVYSSIRAIGREQPPCIDVTTDDTGRAWHEIWDNDHIPLGSAVVVSQSPSAAATLAKTIEVADISITLVNPTNEQVVGSVVAGTLPNATADVFVTVDGSTGHGERLLPNVSGDWTADFTSLPAYDIAGDTWAYARIIDPDGDSSAFGRNSPFVSAYPTGGPYGGPSAIQGEDFPPNAVLTVDVFEDESATTTLFSGTVSVSASGEGGRGLPIALVPGNLVRVSDPILGVTKEVVIADFSMTFVDTVADTVEGTAPEGGDWGDIELYLPDDFSTSAVNIPRTATWSVSLASFGDVTDWFFADAAIRDTDNDHLVAWRNAPAVEVHVSPGGAAMWPDPAVNATSFRPFVLVTFDVFADDAAALANTPMFSEVRTTTVTGEASLAWDVFGGAFAPGNVIRVAGGGVSFERTVVAMTWTIDTSNVPVSDADGSPRYALSGQVPAGSELAVFQMEGDGGGEVCFGCLDGTNYPEVTEYPEGSGNWSIDPQRFSVGRHTGFGVAVAGTVGGKGAFAVFVNPATNVVELRGALPSESVQIEIAASGGSPVLYSEPVVADGLGSATIGFGTHGIDVVTDQVVTIRGLDTGWVQSVVVDPFAFTTLDDATDVVAGTAPAGKEVWIRVDTGSTDEGFIVEADSSGNWSLDLTGRFDVTAGTAGIAAVRPVWPLDNAVVLRGPVTAAITEPSTESTTVTTDITSDGATATDPVETTVVVPPGVSGSVSIMEEEVIPADPMEWAIIEEEVFITAPQATAEDPLELQFAIEEEVLGGRSADDLEVFRDGVLLEECIGAGADPDPCVSGQTVVDGDAQITVLTSTASQWSFGFAQLLSGAALTPNPLRHGLPTALTVQVQNAITSAEYFIGADPGAGNGTMMQVSGTLATATVNGDGSLAVGRYRVGVRGHDGLAWSPTVDAYLVVYDPGAGAVSGSGSIIPQGATSDIFPPDALPAIDGTRTATFSLNAKYGKGAAVPSGALSFTYGTALDVVSTSLSWLSVTTPNATFQGTATVNGIAGYTFRVEVTDGSPDRFELRLWAPSDDSDRDPATYQATGDLIRGRIRLR